MRRPAGRERTGHPPVQNAVPIPPLHRTEPRMKGLRHRRRMHRTAGHAKIRRAHVRIQRIAQHPRSVIARQIDMHRLIERMHPGIGAPGGTDLNLAPGQTPERNLQRLLHAEPAALALPPDEPRPVVTDPQRVPHPVTISPSGRSACCRPYRPARAA